MWETWVLSLGWEDALGQGNLILYRPLLLLPPIPPSIRVMVHECAVPQVSPIRWGLYLAGKESACNVGDLGSIPGLGRYPGEGMGALSRLGAELELRRSGSSLGPSQ